MPHRITASRAAEVAGAKETDTDGIGDFFGSADGDGTAEDAIAADGTTGANAVRTPEPMSNSDPSGSEPELTTMSVPAVTWVGPS